MKLSDAPAQPVLASKMLIGTRHEGFFDIVRVPDGSARQGCNHKPSKLLNGGFCYGASSIGERQPGTPPGAPLVAATGVREIHASASALREAIG